MKITRRQLRVEVPTVAMGDIAFNLLVFFVILARAQDDSHVQWDPAQAPKVENMGRARATVAVDRERKVYVNGRQVGIAQVRQAIEDLLSGAEGDDRMVFLKVDKETPAELFEPIIEAVSEAGGKLVHVLNEDKP